MVERLAARAWWRHGAGAAVEIEAALALLLVLVLGLVVVGGVLVVAGQRLVGIVGDALLQHLEVEHAKQRVAAADIGIEEAERVAGIDGLDPERDLGQFHRHRVAVHAVDAATGNIAQGVAEVLGGGRALGADAGEAGGDAAGGGEQEVAGAAGGVDETEPQKPILGEQGMANGEWGFRPKADQVFLRWKLRCIATIRLAGFRTLCQTSGAR